MVLSKLMEMKVTIFLNCVDISLKTMPKKIPCSFLDLTEALEAAMEHMKEMDWEAILDQEDMNREGFEYIDDDDEVSSELVN